MELTMAAQDVATPWDVPPDTVNFSTDSDASLPGRAYFSKLGIVRRKPARGDAPPTLSKSCSDKLALKQCTSLLASLTSLFISPENAYINTLVLPASQYSPTGCQRAFSEHGRMQSLKGYQWASGYAFTPFIMDTTSVEFKFSKRAVSQRSDKITSSPQAAAWLASHIEETIHGGVIQGTKPFDVKGASNLSRRRMWLAARDLADRPCEDLEDIRNVLNCCTYDQVKTGTLLIDRAMVKGHARGTALTGWIKNDGDSSFTIDSSTTP
jgi:tRNA-specific adenosine deaminase 1